MVLRGISSSFDSARVLETEPADIVTDETGTFSASTTLPEGQQGERNITASDESNRAATIKVDIT